MNSKKMDQLSNQLNKVIDKLEDHKDILKLNNELNTLKKVSFELYCASEKKELDDKL